MRILKALGSSLTGFLIVGLVGSMMTFLPNMDSPSIIGLIIVWSLSLIIAVSNFLNRLKPSLMTRFMIFFNITNFFLAIAVHGLSILLSGWLWIVTLLSVYIFVWVLPFINPHLAKYLNDSQYLLRPRPMKNRSSRLVILFSFIGLGLLFIVLYVLVSHGPLYVQSPGMLFIGMIGALLAIGGGQNFAYKVWQERQNLP